MVEIASKRMVKITINIADFTPEKTVIIMDITYFRRNFPVMVFVIILSVETFSGDI